MSSFDHKYIAHVRESDDAIQTLEAHLEETATYSSSFSTNIGLPLCGRLVGLLHDIGKYSSAFQKYIRDITGLNGEDARIAAENLQGTIDHATSGAQFIWEAQSAKCIPSSLAQILSVVIMSHHSRTGMADFVDLSGQSPFLNRLGKEDAKTYKSEATGKASLAILNEINRIIDSPDLADEFKSAIGHINDATRDLVPRQNTFALLTRFLFSCLLDADRISTADFENPGAARFRTAGDAPDWTRILTVFETQIGGFKQDSEINRIRARISDECRAAATRSQRLFTLQVPTGGGKTLASLRFALHRACQRRPIGWTGSSTCFPTRPFLIRTPKMFAKSSARSSSTLFSNTTPILPKKGTPGATVSSPKTGTHPSSSRPVFNFSMLFLPPVPRPPGACISSATRS
jgi:CRISPR-associated endonuclease/helicase Cas3